MKKYENLIHAIPNRACKAEGSPSLINPQLPDPFFQPPESEKFKKTWWIVEISRCIGIEIDNRVLRLAIHWVVNYIYHFIW